MKKLASFLAFWGLFLLASGAALATPPRDKRVEKIKAQLRFVNLFGIPQAPTSITQISMADFQGVATASAGCPPVGKARAYYDPNTNQFRVVDSSCNLIIAGSGGGPTSVAWNQLLNPNGNSTPDFGGATFTFANGLWDWGTLRTVLTHSGGFTPVLGGETGYDEGTSNWLFNNGAASVALLVPLTATINTGDLASFTKDSGTGKITITPTTPNASSGSSILQITNINPQIGDVPCITDLGPPLEFENCTPGVPINPQTGTTYTYTSDDRGVAVVSSNVGAQTYTLPLLSEANLMAANFFFFQLNKNTGTVTVNATAPNIFDTNGTSSEQIRKGENVTFLTDPDTGIIYPKFSPGRLTAGTGVTITPTADGYGQTINATGSGGTVTGTGTTNTVVKWTNGGAGIIGDSSTLDDGSNPARNDHGFDVNSLGDFQYWIANNASTGTVLNKMACDDGAGKGKNCDHTTTSTNVPLGIARPANGAAGPGTTGSTGLCQLGFCPWIMDNGATAGHYAQMSTSVDGDGSDVGSSAPTNGLPYWTIVVGNSGAGTAATIRNMAPSEMLDSGLGGNKKFSQSACETGLGDGLNAMAAGTYLQFFCVNKTTGNWTLTGFNCWTDNAGSSTLNAANNAGTGLLTGAITCNNTKASGGASGTQSATVTLAPGDAISFTFVADGTSKQTTWSVSFTR